MYWGYHLMLDCSGCDVVRIRDRDTIANFVRVLVKRIGMVAFGEPLIEYFAAGAEDKAGFSMVQLIETSSITAHFVDRDAHAYIDIFSCKSFDTDVCKNTVEEFFTAQKIRVNFITRNAG